MGFSSRFYMATTLVTVTMIISLTGCAIGGLSSSSSNEAAIDSSIHTASLGASQPAWDATMLSDQRVMRDQVMNAPLLNKSGLPLLWLNPETGSMGELKNIKATKIQGKNCRSFDTMRSAFDGVVLYQGEVCEVAKDIWSMMRFAESES